EDLQSVALWTERYVVVVPADHELARAWDAHAHPGPGDASDPTDPTDPAPSGAAPSLRGGPAGGGLDPAAVARHPLIAVARPGAASDPADPTDPAPSGAAPSLRGGPAGGGLDPAAVARHPLIAVARPGAEVDPDTGSALRAWGLEIPVAWQTEQPQTVVNLARAGLGVGV